MTKKYNKLLVEFNSLSDQLANILMPNKAKIKKGKKLRLRMEMLDQEMEKETAYRHGTRNNDQVGKRQNEQRKKINTVGQR